MHLRSGGVKLKSGGVKLKSGGVKLRFGGVELKSRGYQEELIIEKLYEHFGDKRVYTAG